MVVDDDEKGIGIVQADMMKTSALEYNMDSLVQVANATLNFGMIYQKK